MNPLLKALIGSGVRWLMAIAGAHGVEVGSDEANTIVDSLLVAAPILWSIYQKYRTHEVIKDARAGY